MAVTDTEDYGLITEGLSGETLGLFEVDDRPVDDISRDQFRYLADNFARINTLFTALFPLVDWGLITEVAAETEDYGTIT